MAKQLQVIHVPAIDQRVDILTKVFTPLNFTTYKSKLIVVKRHFANPSWACRGYRYLLDSVIFFFLANLKMLKYS